MGFTKNISTSRVSSIVHTKVNRFISAIAHRDSLLSIFALPISSPSQRMLRSSPYLPTRKQGRKSWANGPYYRPSRVLCLGVCSPHAGHCAVPQLVWDQSIGESSPGDTSLMLSVPRSRDSGSPDRKIRRPSKPYLEFSHSHTSGKLSKR